MFNRYRYFQPTTTLLILGLLLGVTPARAMNDKTACNAALLNSEKNWFQAAVESSIPDGMHEQFRASVFFSKSVRTDIRKNERELVVKKLVEKLAFILQNPSTMIARKKLTFTSREPIYVETFASPTGTLQIFYRLGRRRELIVLHIVVNDIDHLDRNGTELLRSRVETASIEFSDLFSERTN